LGIFERHRINYIYSFITNELSPYNAKHKIMKKIYFLVFFSITFFISNAQNLITVADSIRIKSKIPQLAFAIISPNSILEAQTIGFHKTGFNDDENKAKITDYFHLGSNTKAITGFIAASLVEQNKIKWTTKFFDLFPKWKNDSNKAFHIITLEDLLSHRARIQPYTSGKEYQKLPLFEGSTSEKRKQFCNYILKNEPVKLNDNAYNYSNAGYSIASLMLEKVTARTWEQLVNETLTEKLKFNYKLGWPNRFETNQPWGHWIEKDALVAVSPETNYNLNLAEPAGDISMPINDYARFIQLNLEGLSGKNNFLKSETYHFLHNSKEKYAIGWANANTPEMKISEHAGTDGTFFCYTQIDKNKNLAYIIVINCATKDAQKGVFDLLLFMKKKYGNK
jgi:D-alanyl-D-alanine carboxypeptidase